MDGRIFACYASKNKLIGRESTLFYLGNIFYLYNQKSSLPVKKYASSYSA